MADLRGTANLSSVAITHKSRDDIAIYDRSLGRCFELQYNRLASGYFGREVTPTERILLKQEDCGQSAYDLDRK